MLEDIEKWKELDDIETLREALTHLHYHVEKGRECAIGLADVEIDLLQKLIWEALEKEPSENGL